jgi:LCP family protein required for cell wall assembly
MRLKFGLARRAAALGPDTVAAPAFDAPAPDQAAALAPDTTAAPALDSAAGLAVAPAHSRLVAALLSFLWPGLGQLYARRRLTAVVFAVPVVVGFGWLAVQLLNGLDWFSLALLDKSFALTLMIGAAVLGAWRLVAMAHAYATAGPLRRPRFVESGLLAVLVVVVVAVHTEAAYYAWSFYDFDNQVASNVLPENRQSQLPTATGAPTASPTPYEWLPGATYEAPVATPEVTTEPPASHHLTMMLAGLDWLPGRTGGQYDALMLVSLDTETNKVHMISFPRDTAYFDYYWGGQAGVNTKLNNFANLVARGQIKAPDKYLTAMANELGYLAGIKVDYYAVIDMEGFISLVNSAGGVCLTVPKAVVDPSTHTSIGAGYQCMSGAIALKYARSRHTSNDYVRAGRQQALIAALAKRIASPAGIGRLPKLLSLGSKIIQTNFPLNTAKNFVTTIRLIGAGDITNCVLGPPYSYHPAATLTKGAWTARLKLPTVAGLSVELFGTDSRYYGMQGIVPAPCQYSA